MTSREEKWWQGGSVLLLFLLVVVYVVSSFVGTGGPASQLINLLTFGVVFLGLRESIARERVRRVSILVILALLAASALIQELAPGKSYRWDSLVVTFVTFLMFLAMFRVVMRKERVTTNKIAAAACVYMLMGICWGMAYVLLHQASPEAFNLSEADLLEPAEALIHFSFTTLTTVGYGNISPMTEASRAMSDIESVVGQLYLTIVVARLVSLQVAPDTQG